jgi:hypothetical protein
MKLGKTLLTLAAVGALALAVAGTAQATTYCVPTLAACPGEVGTAVADVEEAMNLNGSDDEPDQVFIAGGTYTEDADFEPPSGSVGTFQVTGADPLTITGAGRGVTHLTSTATGNIFLVNLGHNGNARDVVISDLTLQVPTSFNDNAGAAIQLFHGDTAERVTVESLNNGSDGFIASDPGNVARDCDLFANPGGALATAFRAGSAESGLLVEDSQISSAAWALAAGGKDATLTARRVQAFGTRTYGAVASAGTLRVENSLLNMEDGIGLFVSPAADDATLIADHVTFFNSEGTVPALEAKKFGVTAGKGTLEVSNSILRGFGSGYRIEGLVGSGALSIKVRYSNLPLTGTNENGAVDLTTGNIDADPLWNLAYQLPPESPSVDAGDPAPGGLATDFLGAPRPNDGDGDGAAVRDQGMFEYQRPAPAGPSGSGTVIIGENLPLILPRRVETYITSGPGRGLARGQARFTFRANPKRARFQCKLDKRKARPCKSPKIYTRLKPGRHLFKVWAIDKAGNKDPTPAKRRFRVPV